jgi:hypothetical protein
VRRLARGTALRARGVRRGRRRALARSPAPLGLAREEVPDAARIRSWLDAECVHGDRWLGHVVIALMAEVLTRG